HRMMVSEYCTLDYYIVSTFVVVFLLVVFFFFVFCLFVLLYVFVLLFFFFFCCFIFFFFFFFFQAEDGIRDRNVTGVQTCALPIYRVTLFCISRPGVFYLILFHTLSSLWNLFF